MQDNNAAKIDTLVLYIYIPGKPYPASLEAQQQVAKKWGFAIQFEFGDCSGETPESIKKEMETKNIPVFNYLAMKYGGDWQTLFNEEVEKILVNSK